MIEIVAPTPALAVALTIFLTEEGHASLWLTGSICLTMAPRSVVDMACTALYTTFAPR